MVDLGLKTVMLGGHISESMMDDSTTIAERIRNLFGDAPCRLQVAALPWWKVSGDIKVMLITSRDSGRWVLPKGWTEKGEAHWDAAAREAREEAGLKGEIAQDEAGRFLYRKLKPSGMVPCEVVVYPLRVEKVCDNWKEMGERRRSWFSPSDAAASVNEPDLAEILAGFSRNFLRFAA